MTRLADSDGCRLYVESTGSGVPIVFVHEFAGDLRDWEEQVRFFGRRYRCITFNARGYPPSDVPTDVEQYSQAHAVEDIANVMRTSGWRVRTSSVSRWPANPRLIPKATSLTLTVTVSYELG